MFSDTHGNRVIIDHGPSKTGEGNVYTLYAHGSKILVKNGQIVKVGEEIMKSGNTGSNTTGPHVHYEVIVTKIKVNTQEFFSNYKIRRSPKDIYNYL